MKVTKDIIQDLYPLYATNDCSEDTRTMVEEYLRENPEAAVYLRRVMETDIPKMQRQEKPLEETKSFREARRRLRIRATLMGFAIFFSLAPFSINKTDKGVWFCLTDAPGTALAYASIGAVFWFFYARNRKQSRSL